MGSPTLHPGYRFIGTFGARSLIDIVTLDLRIEEEISKYGTLNDFHIVLWRQDPNTTGCNWDAHRADSRYLDRFALVGRDPADARAL
jgi:hypothetical protein